MGKTYRRIDRELSANYKDWKMNAGRNRFIGNEDGTLVTRDGISATMERQEIKRESRKSRRQADKRAMRDY